MLAERFFRQEYARLVARLSRQFGIEHIEDIEDAVQSSLVIGLEIWTTHKLPQDPSAWLARVAQNKLFETLWQDRRRRELLIQAATSRWQSARCRTRSPESRARPGTRPRPLDHVAGLCHPDLLQ